MQINYIYGYFPFFHSKLFVFLIITFQQSERNENFPIYGGINNYFWTCLFYGQIYLIQEYLFEIFLSVQIHNTIS